MPLNHGARRGTDIFARYSPTFRPLHGDPRWGAFLKRMRLADQGVGDAR